MFVDLPLSMLLSTVEKEGMHLQQDSEALSNAHKKTCNIQKETSKANDKKGGTCDL